MKLEDLHEQKRTIVLSEGLLGDLLRVGVSKIQASLPTNKELLDSVPGLDALLSHAQSADYSLLDMDKSADWWRSLFSKFEMDIDSDDKAQAIFRDVTDRLESRIDRSLEDPERRMEQQREKEEQRRARKAAREEEGERRRGSRRRRLGEDATDFLGNILDMLSPAGRAKAGARMARASNNARIAVAAMNAIDKRTGFLKKKKQEQEEPVQAEVVDEPKSASDLDRNIDEVQRAYGDDPRKRLTSFEYMAGQIRKAGNKVPGKLQKLIDELRDELKTGISHKPNKAETLSSEEAERQVYDFLLKNRRKDPKAQLMHCNAVRRWLHDKGIEVPEILSDEIEELELKQG